MFDDDDVNDGNDDNNDDWHYHAFKEILDNTVFKLPIFWTDE